MTASAATAVTHHPPPRPGLCCCGDQEGTRSWPGVPSEGNRQPPPDPVSISSDPVVTSGTSHSIFSLKISHTNINRPTEAEDPSVALSPPRPPPPAYRLLEAGLTITIHHTKENKVWRNKNQSKAANGRQTLKNGLCRAVMLGKPGLHLEQEGLAPPA